MEIYFGEHFFPESRVSPKQKNIFLPRDLFQPEKVSFFFAQFKRSRSQKVSCFCGKTRDSEKKKVLQMILQIWPFLVKKNPIFIDFPANSAPILVEQKGSHEKNSCLFFVGRGAVVLGAENPLFQGFGGKLSFFSRGFSGKCPLIVFCLFFLVWFFFSGRVPDGSPD